MMQSNLFSDACAWCLNEASWWTHSQCLDLNLLPWMIYSNNLELSMIRKLTSAWSGSAKEGRSDLGGQKSHALPMQFTESESCQCAEQHLVFYAAFVTLDLSPRSKAWGSWFEIGIKEEKHWSSQCYNHEIQNFIIRQPVAKNRELWTSKLEYHEVQEFRL